MARTVVLIGGVSAALSGDPHLAHQAMLASPMVTNKDTASVLTDELLAAQHAFLPQFT
jgi:alpha-galactosidase/6-phospho-beta-glucosidase family protein